MNMESTTIPFMPKIPDGIYDNRDAQRRELWREAHLAISISRKMVENRLAKECLHPNWSKPWLSYPIIVSEHRATVTMSDGTIYLIFKSTKQRVQHPG